MVGCVGRIKLIRKGQEFLLRAAAILKKRGVTAKHLIVGATFPGNEAHLDVLHAIARAAGLGDDVIFTGEIPDARPAYAAMNIFALPSAQPEPCGGGVMEATGMGLPVVARKSAARSSRLPMAKAAFGCATTARKRASSATSATAFPKSKRRARTARGPSIR